MDDTSAVGNDRKPGRGPNIVFRPEGFLVVMLAGEAEGRIAVTALRDAGFAEQELKLSTSEEILANYERYVDDRTAPGTDDRVRHG